MMKSEASSGYAYLLWAIASPDKLSASTAALLTSAGNDLVFSVASLWEVAIKSTAKSGVGMIDVRLLRDGLLKHHYQELSIQGRHALCVAQLPLLHRDPFDRILVRQSPAIRAHFTWHKQKSR